MNLFTKASLASLALFSAIPTFAQGTDDVRPGDEKINQLIIYGNDPCPESKGDEIVVCAVLNEAERYRIPTNLRDNPNNVSNETWTRKIESYRYVGASGTQSCSATGPGGFTGCGIGAINAAYAEKDQDPGIQFGRLIAEERRKRLGGIDAESEQVEQRVKQFEKERAEKEARENGDAIPQDDSAIAAPLPEPK